MNPAMFEVIGNSSNRPEWLKLRNESIGASDAAGVLGCSPWSSPVSVFADKVLGEDLDYDNEPMYWGRRLEATILEHFGDEVGRTVEPSGDLIRSKEWPFMTCTLDGIQHDENGCMAPVEVKNTRIYIDKIPKQYWIQMQHQFAVSGATWGSFAALVMGSQFVWADVQRSEEFIQETLVPRCEAFWKRVGASGPTPQADASDATLAALKRLYPHDDGNSIKLDGEWLPLDVERQRIVQELKALEVEKQGIDNQIKREIGGASSAILPNGRTYTYKANKNGVRSLRAPRIEEGQKQ